MAKQEDFEQPRPYTCEACKYFRRQAVNARDSGNKYNRCVWPKENKCPPWIAGGSNWKLDIKDGGFCRVFDCKEPGGCQDPPKPPRKRTDEIEIPTRGGALKMNKKGRIYNPAKTNPEEA